MTNETLPGLAKGLELIIDQRKRNVSRELLPVWGTELGRQGCDVFGGDEPRGQRLHHHSKHLDLLQSLRRFERELQAAGTSCCLNQITSPEADRSSVGGDLNGPYTEHSSTVSRASLIKMKTNASTFHFPGATYCFYIRRFFLEHVPMTAFIHSHGPCSRLT